MRPRQAVVENNASPIGDAVAALRLEAHKLARDNVEVNGKSIMGIMMLAAAKGTTVRLTVDGVDETAALQDLGELIKNGFGEE